MPSCYTELVKKMLHNTHKVTLRDGEATALNPEGPGRPRGSGRSPKGRRGVKVSQGKDTTKGKVQQAVKGPEHRSDNMSR